MNEKSVGLHLGLVWADVTKHNNRWNLEYLGMRMIFAGLKYAVLEVFEYFVEITYTLWLLER